MRQKSAILAALALLSMPPGCGGDEEEAGPQPADGGSDGATMPEDAADTAAVPEAAEPDVAHEPDVAVGPDSDPPTPTEGPRAYVIGPEHAADLAGGPLASARVGDVVIMNDHVRFVVRTGEHALYLHGVGGGAVVDAGPAAADGLQEIVPIVDFHSFGPGTVDITRNGSDGAAEVQVRTQGALPSIVGAWVPTLDLEITVDQTYRLEADSRALEMVLQSDTIDEALVGEVMFTGGELELRVSSKAGWVVAEGSEVTYGLLSDSEIDPQEIDSLTIFLGPIMPPPIAWVRWLVVGDGSMSSVTDQFLELRLSPRGTVSGTVDDPAAVVAAYDGDGELFTRFRPDAGGAFQGLLPPGVFELRAQSPGGVTGAAVVVEMEDEGSVGGVQVHAAQPAWVEVTVDAATRLSIQGKSGHKATVPVAPGTTRVPVPPGEHTIWAVRGFEHEADQLETTLEAGEDVQWSPSLPRTVDTKGWIASEFHIHSEWSPDSTVPLADRVLACAAEGIEYAVATDHDVVTDYGPAVLPSLEGAIVVASGEEVSTAKLGHLNVWPLVPDPDLPGHGSIQWFGLGLPALLDALGAGQPGRVVQVNHGRGGSSSTFDLVGYDSSVPDPELLARFTFGAMELINSGGSAFDALVADWFSFLNNGLDVAGTGTSDSHSISSFCGHARTFVEVDDDDPASAKAADIDAAVLAGRTMVSSGPFLTLEKAGNGLVHVRVAGPSWMPVERVRLYADGEPDVVVDVPPYGGDTVRFDADVPLAAPSPAWVVGIAEADSVPQPMLKAKVRAVSPPVWLWPGSR